MPARARTVSVAHDNRTRLLHAAGEYVRRGYSLTPTKASTTKGAYLPSWQTRRLTVAQLAAELDHPGKGIGVVLGEASGGLVDVDLDHPAAVEAADVLLPPTGLVSGRTSRPRTHRFYRSAGAATAQFKASATGMLVELRAAGCQTVLPPSPHSEGRYHWDALGDPTVVEAGLLRRTTGQVAATAFLIAQGWPAGHAVAFARQPDLERIAEWERVNDDCPAFRSWLLLQRKRAACSSTRVVPTIERSAASPFTQAILLRVGGVVGAACLLGLELREGRQRCPWHEGKGARSLQVTGSLWRCHAGCGSGNSIHLAMKALGLDYRRARNALARRLGIRWQDHAPPRRGGGKRTGRDEPATEMEAHDEAHPLRRADEGLRV